MFKAEGSLTPILFDRLSRQEVVVSVIADCGLPEKAYSELSGGFSNKGE